MAYVNFEQVLNGKYPAKSHAQRTAQTDHSILFIPPIVDADVIWAGLPTTTEEALEKYDVDEVRHTTQVADTLAELAGTNPGSTVYTIESQSSGNTPLSMFQEHDAQSIKLILEKCRVVKDEYEIAMIRKANYITCRGIEAVMARAKTAETEAELEAAFRERCISHHSKETTYPPIVAAGAGAATLHYVDNQQPLKGKLNLLIDAGCEWNNYASDITRTFPLTGKFTEESRKIYDLVHKMTVDTTNELRAGVVFEDLHILTHKIAIDGLLELGILQGDRDEIFAARTSTAFFPVGLGHHLGLDCHDTGGGQNRQDPDKLFPNLRLRGTVPAGSVVTIEPGIYFCEFLIKPFLLDPAHSKFFNQAVLDKYWTVGGIRQVFLSIQENILENNVLVTETGTENFTTIPMDADSVEALCK
ncbi:hypothetical protein K4F52_008340 [Lecanicillium sp. MT-2017a]|nr:hypothetical protein K4F52_008340 [Lecanicillium sp. MT-2017a]